MLHRHAGGCEDGFADSDLPKEKGKAKTFIDPLDILPGRFRNIRRLRTGGRFSTLLRPTLRRDRP